MDMGFISEVILPIVFVIVGIVLIVALVEVIKTLRKARETVDNVEKQILPVVADVKEMTESLKPAVDKVCGGFYKLSAFIRCARVGLCCRISCGKHSRNHLSRSHRADPADLCELCACDAVQAKYGEDHSIALIFKNSVNIKLQGFHLFIS